MGSITFYLRYYIADIFFSLGEMETSVSFHKKIMILNGFMCLNVKPGGHQEYGPFPALWAHNTEAVLAMVIILVPSN